MQRTLSKQTLILRLGGEPKKITELREGKLLIEVQNEQQSVRVKEIEKSHDTKVTVTEHNSLI